MGIKKLLGSVVACSLSILLIPKSLLADNERFLWGASYSAHQTEGGNDHSDWWDWEHTKGHVVDGQTTAIATDHYHRYEEDFDLAQKLGLNTVRFSVSWSRIEPEKDRFDEKELKHYLDVVLALRARGIEPIVALHHFTHPPWFHAMGGWTNPESPKIFARFAEKVAFALYPYVHIWITFNEPVVQMVEGYLKGGYPPGIKDFTSAVKVYENLVTAHGEAAQVLRTNLPTIAGPIHGVGLALNLNVFDPVNDPSSPKGKEDLEAIHVLERLSFWAFLDATQTGKLQWYIPPLPKLKNGHSENVSIPIAAHSLDWIGINYYSRYLIARDQRNDIGARWVTPKEGLIYPNGIERLLKAAKTHLKDPIPFIISENGLDDAKDQNRAAFIQDHLNSIQKARADGIDVRGYWYWSLTDNFEWLSGFKPAFGLIDIHYSNLQRQIRPSAYWYRDFILTHPGGP